MKDKYNYTITGALITDWSQVTIIGGTFIIHEDEKEVYFNYTKYSSPTKKPGTNRI